MHGKISEKMWAISLTRDEALAFVNTEISKHREKLVTMSEE